jgi:hypothetical protein
MWQIKEIQVVVVYFFEIVEKKWYNNDWNVLSKKWNVWWRGDRCVMVTRKAIIFELWAVVSIIVTLLFCLHF